MYQLGLIGYPLSHSYSKKYFEEKFKKEGINRFSYELFPLENLDLLPQLVAAMPNLIGLNVTTPYKEKVISFLDELDEEAKKIGAVNCILISRKDGNLKLKGFNTDLFGFRQSIKPFLESQHERALILGSGGAAKAVKYTLEKIGVPCWIVSRKNNRTPGENFFQYEELNENILRQFKLIVNASPVGTFPNSEEFPQLPYDGIEAGHLLYDLVYNPSETVFLKKGKERNAVCMNGLSMLYHQADEAFRIWQTGINQGL